MANGVLKDEATYYEDSEKYTGESGSSTNMWVIEDVYDFVSALNMSDNAHLVNDIDFNNHNTYKKGISDVSFSSSLNLYGDNHKIKNLVCMENSNIQITSISDCDFVNLVSINQTMFPIYSNMSGCNFGVFVSNSRIGFGEIGDGGRTVDGSTFNIKGKTRSDSGFIYIAPNWSFNACHFNFDVNVPFGNESVFGTDTASSSYKGYFVNSYFTGKLNNTTQNYMIYFTKHIYFTNCYFAFEWAGTYYAYGSDAGSFSTCFVDKELFNKNGNNWKSQSGVSELTTAQAQDADYLNSIGFLVIPVE